MVVKEKREPKNGFQSAHQTGFSRGNVFLGYRLPTASRSR